MLSNPSTVTEDIRTSRFGWFGHVQRMIDTRITKKVLTAQIGMVRRRERPRNRWMDGFKKKKRIHNWEELIKTRKEWRKRKKR